jgi:hypothetical protein
LDLNWPTWSLLAFVSLMPPLPGIFELLYRCNRSVDLSLRRLSVVLCTKKRLIVHMLFLVLCPRTLWIPVWTNREKKDDAMFFKILLLWFVYFNSLII